MAHLIFIKIKRVRGRTVPTLLVLLQDLILKSFHNYYPNGVIAFIIIGYTHNLFHKIPIDYINDFKELSSLYYKTFSILRLLSFTTEDTTVIKRNQRFMVM